MDELSQIVVAALRILNPEGEALGLGVASGMTEATPQGPQATGDNCDTIPPPAT